MSADTPTIANHLESSDARRGAAVFAIDHHAVDERTTVVAVEGDLDLASAPMLKRVLVERLGSGARSLVVDLSRVRFLDSTALGVLVGVHRKLQSDERVAIAGAPTPVQKVLEVSGLSPSFQVFPALDDALDYMRGEVPHDTPAGPPLTGDVTLMLGIASTAMPFAESVEDEAERWLRLLRRHGEAGFLLASLGVSEARLKGPNELLPGARPKLGVSHVIENVIAGAGQIATRREAAKVSTTDVLLAVIEVYGDVFDRVLQAHGGNVDELTGRLLD